MTPVVTTALSLAYVIPIALLAWYLAAGRNRRPRWLLMMILAALPLFYAGHYLLLQQIQGWPSTAGLPDEFQLLGFEISEPGTGVTENGGILLWARATGRQTPRVHRLAYSRTLHQELVSAGERLAKGRAQTGIRSRSTGTGTVQTAEGPGDRIRFEDTRDSVLPTKE